MTKCYPAQGHAPLPLQNPPPTAPIPEAHTLWEEGMQQRVTKSGISSTSHEAVFRKGEGMRTVLKIIGHHNHSLEHIEKHRSSLSSFESGFHIIKGAFYCCMFLRKSTECKLAPWKPTALHYGMQSMHFLKWLSCLETANISDEQVG